MGQRHNRIFRNICGMLPCLTLLALAPVAMAGSSLPTSAPSSCQLTPGPRRTVVKVIDAQTLELDDGSQLRLIGALPPYPPVTTERLNKSRIKHDIRPVFWPLLRHARKTLEQMVLNRSVELAFGTRRQDRYGQVLAQVFVVARPEKNMKTGRAPRSNTNDRTSFWLQSRLIAQGLARAYAVPGADYCLAALLDVESEAMRAGAGLWNNAAYQIRDARKTKELLRYRGSYQLVEGRVVKVGRSKSRYYLNFGRNWRTDFTVSIDKKYLRLFAAQGLPVRQLAGQYIRVRGWIDARGGPLIEVFNSRQIELRSPPTRRNR